MQWQPAIGAGMDRYEMALDVFKRCTNIDDKAAIISAIETMKLECIGGPVDFTAPLDADPFAPTSFRPHPNVYKGCVGAHQWRKTTGGKWAYEPVVVSALCFPADSAKPAVVDPILYKY